MNKRIVKNIVATILYVIAVIFLVYTVWSMVTITTYITDLIQQGAIDVKTQVYDIFNFYMSNGAQYLATTALLGAMGYAIQIIGRPVKTKEEKQEQKAKKVEPKEKTVAETKTTTKKETTKKEEK